LFENNNNKSVPGVGVDDESLNALRRQNGIKATILLGELLHLSSFTLAPEQVKVSLLLLLLLLLCCFWKFASYIGKFKQNY
jgi:hypothetical protein